MKSVNRKNDLQREEGFTLIEIIIAMGLLAFGLLAMASMQVMAIKTNGKANRITEAATLNMEQMEILRLANISTIANQDWTPLSTSGLYQFRVINVNDQGLSPANYRRFQVEIRSTNPFVLNNQTIIYNGISTSGI